MGYEPEPTIRRRMRIKDVVIGAGMFLGFMAAACVFVGAIVGVGFLIAYGPWGWAVAIIVIFIMIIALTMGVWWAKIEQDYGR